MIFREKEYPYQFITYTTNTSPAFDYNTSIADSGSSMFVGASASSSGEMSTTRNFASQDIGTGWGHQKRSHVTTVDFEREDSYDALFELFYNTRKQLKRMGVNFHKPVYISPKSFPGGYCQPPN